MSNAIFPTFDGLTWSVFKSPSWTTKIRTSVSQREVRSAYQVRPKWRFTLSYEVLRNYQAFTEFNQLCAFFNQRMGAFDSFLLYDDSDHTSTAQLFGTGDGVTTKFALLHNIGGFAEPIGYSSDAVISKAGVVQSSPGQYTSDGATITFATAPASGAALTWSGTFYYRVRFDKDTLEFEQFLKDFWSLKKCELIGVFDA